jgi:hypothetical protein
MTIKKPSNDDISRFSKHKGVIKPDEAELKKFGTCVNTTITTSRTIPVRQDLLVIPAESPKKDIGWSFIECSSEAGPITVEKMPQKIGTEKINVYRSNHGVEYQKPTNRAWTSIKVLQFLYGRQCNDLILSYIHALRPSAIRVVNQNECITCDAITWRVTVFVDSKNKVKSIEQEVEVASCEPFENGYQLDKFLKYGKFFRMPKGGVVMWNPKAIARVKKGDKK